ncbi:MAG: carbon-nitrogen hydrolase family protein [Verrucomicrobiales bacterium]|nr:carbon-nitrogen hydrolase family protein [Verrucomicrobiales bacterium]
MRIPFVIIFVSFMWNSGVSNESGSWTLKSMSTGVPVEGVRQDQNTLTLISPQEEGAAGYWEKEFPVEGKSWVEFSVERIAVGVSYPRRSCVVRIEWYGANGKPVPSAESVNPTYFGSATTLARPDFPRDHASTSEGQVTVSDRYPVPPAAATAVVQLHLRWAPGGIVKWETPALSVCDPLPERNVVLAAVHASLAGGKRSLQENHEEFLPLIEEAAVQGADLIVLPELLNCKGVTHEYAGAAETIPGNTTRFFGKLSRAHELYLVVGMAEREGKLVYNTAVLLGPEGSVIGKYRKVTLPREEIARGISPGTEYPVFETRFGRVGLMICYDVFHPEVARNLAMNGAEIIAMPIWGGNPALASARCIENGVHLVTSTYTDHDADWMKSAIWNREGERLVTAEEWNSIVATKVDLNQRTYWHGLGDFQARIAREAPVRILEPVFDLPKQDEER